MGKPRLFNNKKYDQGFYKIENPDKYLGDPTNCIYRSSWELKFMIYCDSNERIKKWGSETVEIPYVDYDGKKRRYYPDFYLEVIDPNDKCKLDRVLIEVKPSKETKMPIMSKKQTAKALENFEYELKTFKTNLLKWKFALEWCQNRYMKFFVFTEEHLKRGNIL